MPAQAKLSCARLVHRIILGVQDSLRFRFVACQQAFLPPDGSASQ
jgi:hypothetical protein